jgi:hypothetical protein
MSHTIDHARQYWLGFVLPTAKAAMADLRNFQGQLTSLGRQKCLCVSTSHQDSMIMSIVGADIYNSIHLGNFDAVRPLLSRVASTLMDEDPTGSSDLLTIEDVALMWLNDVMVSIYKLAEKYHATIPCISFYVIACSSHETSFSGRFPVAVQWENNRRAENLKKSLANTEFVTIGNDTPKGDNEYMDPSGDTTPPVDGDANMVCDSLMCEYTSQDMPCRVYASPPVVRRKRDSLDEPCPASPCVPKRARVLYQGQ